MHLRSSFYALLVFLLIVGCATRKSAATGAVGETAEVREDSTGLAARFPAELSEISGVARVGEHYFLQNDSGSKPELFEIDATGDTLHTVYVRGVRNVDWEELAVDENYLYIGEFGNNSGDRRDLGIYRIWLADLDRDTVSAAGFTPISYAAQTNFMTRPYLHDFDCEAMVSVGDSLYLFSKDHVDKRTQFFALSKTDSAAVLRARDSFDVRGTLSGAAYRPAGDGHGAELALLGYNFGLLKGFRPFVWLFTDFAGTDFFGGKAAYYELPFREQAEGIEFAPDGELMIATEATVRGRGGWFRWRAE